MEAASMTTVEPPAAPSFEYVPDRVEKIGRRLKMEYFGMTSVFVVIATLFYGDLASVGQTLLATGAIYFLFQGLKKKTRDHLVASFLMFTAAAVGYPAVASAGWGLPFLCFAVCFWAGEGFIEGRRTRIYLVPATFGIWAWFAADPAWLLGLLFFAMYLANPWPVELRRRLTAMAALSVVVAFGIGLFRSGLGAFETAGRMPLAMGHFWLLALIGLPTVLGLAFYWNRLEPSRKWNAVICGLLAPWDVRLLAIFALPATIVLAATMFRQSADSPRIRNIFKHTEWYFFWVVLVVAIWGGIRYFAA